MRTQYIWTAALGGLLALAACQSGPQARGAALSVPQASTPPGGGPSAGMVATGMASAGMMAAAAPATPREVDRQVIAALQNGGYVIYFRHASTDRSQQDSDPQNLANCATQRNLTDDGRAQARATGDAIRSLRIPVGEVLSSEYCRAQEHALLAFGKVTVEPSLVLPDPLPDNERQRNKESLQRLLATPPPPGVNTILISHSPNLKDATDVDLTVEGSAVILRPADGAPAVVALVLPGDWTSLAQAPGSP